MEYTNQTIWTDDQGDIYEAHAYHNESEARVELWHNGVVMTYSRMIHPPLLPENDEVGY